MWLLLLSLTIITCFLHIYPERTWLIFPHLPWAAVTHRCWVDPKPEEGLASPLKSLKAVRLACLNLYPVGG